MTSGGGEVFAGAGVESAKDEPTDIEIAASFSADSVRHLTEPRPRPDVTIVQVLLGRIALSTYRAPVQLLPRLVPPRKALAVRTRLLAIGGLLAAMALFAFPATAMAADTSTSSTSSTTSTTAPPASTTTTSTSTSTSASTTTSTTEPAPTTAGCPAGAAAIENADTNASADSNTITATFKVVAGCHNVQLSLASYRIFSSTNKPLSASVRGFFDAGQGKLVLHLPAECTYDVFLIVGPPPATSPNIDDDIVLAGGTRSSTVCHGGGGGTTTRPPTGQLPFTGTMAMPMLLVGLGLIVGGTTFVLLARTRRTARARH